MLCSAGTLGCWSSLCESSLLQGQHCYPRAPSLSSFSFFLPHRDRAGAARAAFVKHFKALGVRGHARPCQGFFHARDPWIPLAVPASASPTTFLHN